MHVGVHEYGKIGLIAWGVMFPTWLTISAAMSRKLPDTKLMLRAAGVGKGELQRLFVWPRAIGGLVAGLEIGVGLAWLCVVAAEWVGTYTRGFWAGGLGYRLIVSYQNNDWRSLYAALIIFGMLGTASALLWKWCVALIFRRSKGFDPVRWLRRG
jgi:sulfonate transport system permease protein